MIDREKVTDGLRACISIGENGVTHGDCSICPYVKSHECRLELERDALKLLKEQEPKNGHWTVLDSCSNAGVYCSECQTKVFDHYPMPKKLSRFCPHCGAKMAPWDQAVWL